ncbi:MAG: neutral zinc metallopeptidase [Acidobacteriaceae bacterium]
MDWTPGQMSGDVEDRRGDSGGGGGFGFGGGGIGIVGVLVLLAVSLVTGRNYLGAFLSGSSSQSTAPQQQTGPREAGADPSQSPAEDRSAHLASFVLDDAQKTWTETFAAHNRQYRHAKLVLYRGTTYSGCGTAHSQTGPFYCPEDEKIYIDLNFWDELQRLGGDSADFAQAYVVAHELGHHIQKLLGIEQREQQIVQQGGGSRSELSVDTELQADCFAGIWGHSTQQRKIIDSGDVSNALKAAAAVGDDHIAKMQGRAVSPESFTHGTSAQREHWFQTGLDGGEIPQCSTFNGKLEP